MPPDMPAAKLRAGRPEHDDPAAGHVLAAVVADASTTALTPLLRTQKRSPAMPRM